MGCFSAQKSVISDWLLSWGKGEGGLGQAVQQEYYVHDQQPQICQQKFTEFAIIQQNIKQHIWFTENNIQA